MGISPSGMRYREAAFRGPRRCGSSRSNSTRTVPSRCCLVARARVRESGPASAIAREVSANMEPEMLGVKPDMQNLRLVEEITIPHECNWKVSVENYSECYHCPVIHYDLTANILDMNTYRVETHGYVISSHQPAAGVSSRRAETFSHGFSGLISPSRCIHRAVA